MYTPSSEQFPPWRSHTQSRHCKRQSAMESSHVGNADLSSPSNVGNHGSAEPKKNVSYNDKLKLSHLITILL